VIRKCRRFLFAGGRICEPLLRCRARSPPISLVALPVLGGWPKGMAKTCGPAANIAVKPRCAFRLAYLHAGACGPIGVRADARHPKGVLRATPTSQQPELCRQVVRNGQLWKTGLLLSNTFATLENKTSVEQLPLARFRLMRRLRTTLQLSRQRCRDFCQVLLNLLCCCRPANCRFGLMRLPP